MRYFKTSDGRWYEESPFSHPDVDPKTAVRGCTPGGGFVVTVARERIVEWADELPCEPRVGWVGWDDNEPVMRASWDDLDRWNGWLRPRVTLEDLKAALPRLNKWADEEGGARFELDPETNILTVDDRQDEPYEIEPDEAGEYEMSCGMTWVQTPAPREDPQYAKSTLFGIGGALQEALDRAALDIAEYCEFTFRFGNDSLAPWIVNAIHAGCDGDPDAIEETLRYVIEACNDEIAKLAGRA